MLRRLCLIRLEQCPVKNMCRRWGNICLECRGSVDRLTVAMARRTEADSAVSVAPIIWVFERPKGSRYSTARCFKKAEIQLPK